MRGLTPILSILLKMLAIGVVTLLVVSAIIFSEIELLPGDIATEVLGQSATPETLAAFRAQMNLDQPAVLRYMHWLAGAVTGDFGISLANRRPIAELIRRAPPTRSSSPVMRR